MVTERHRRPTMHKTSLTTVETAKNAQTIHADFISFLSIVLIAEIVSTWKQLTHRV